MNILTKISTTGKKSKGNLKTQAYINLLVISGFLLFIFWALFLYPKTFVNIKLILFLLFFPSLIITLFSFKRLLQACGYEHYLQKNLKYNILIVILSYLLTTVPIGNIIVSAFLSVNFFFAQKEVQITYVKPSNIREATSSKSNSRYTKMQVEVFGIRKNINIGNTAIDSVASKFLKLQFSRGFFGYNIIRGYRFDTSGWTQ